MKHVIMGAKFWNSLTSNFKIEISGRKSTTELKIIEEYNRLLLWDFNRFRVNLSSTVGASILKVKIEGKTLLNFSADIIAYNTWFDNTQKIIKDDDKGYKK